jgi:hypothetical protein
LVHRTRPTYFHRLNEDLHSSADGDKLIELNYVGVAEANASGAGGGADEVLAIGAVDVDVAVLAGPIVGLFTVKPENSGKNEVLILSGIRGFPDAAGGFASDELSAGFGVVADLEADAVPTERGLVAVGFRAGPFFGSRDREGAGDGAVIGDDVETLAGDGDAEVHEIRLR